MQKAAAERLRRSVTSGSQPVPGWASLPQTVATLRQGRTTTPGTGCGPPPPSEEAELVFRVRNQKILGLLVMVQHHLVRLAPNARFLVAAKRRVRRVGVVAVGPHTPSLDGAAHAVGHIAVAAP